MQHRLDTRHRARPGAGTRRAGCCRARSARGRPGVLPAPARRRAPRPAPAPSAASSAPSKWMPPRTGRCRPARARISVVLPAPLAPSRATASPWRDLQVDAVQDRRCAIPRDEAADAEHLLARRWARGHRSGGIGGERVAEVGAAHVVVGLDLGRRAGGQALAGVEHDDLVGDGHDQRHVVLDQHHRHAGVGDAPQQRRQAAPCRGATGRRRARRAAARRDRSPARARSRPGAGRRARDRQRARRAGR